jgi:hypothetical protein
LQKTLEFNAQLSMCLECPCHWKIIFAGLMVILERYTFRLVIGDFLLNCIIFHKMAKEDMQNDTFHTTFIK